MPMDAGAGVEKTAAAAGAANFDLSYEFSAPRFFDFCVGETEDEAAAAERWFVRAVSHPPSPLVGKVKSIQELSAGCSLEEYIEVQKLVARVTPELSKVMEIDDRENAGNSLSKTEDRTMMLSQGSHMCWNENGQDFGIHNEPSAEEPCTPKEQFSDRFLELQSLKPSVNTGRVIPSKYKCSDLRKRAVLKSIQTAALSQVAAAQRCLTGPQSVAAKRCLTGPQTGGPTHADKKQKLEGVHASQVLKANMPQAIPTLTISQQFRLNAKHHGPKRQKLEGGHYRQVMHTKKPQAGPSLTIPHEFHFHTDKRAHLHKAAGQCSSEIQAPSLAVGYIPIAEMVQKFQMNLLGEFKSQVKTSILQKTCLRLTHPKEPMLGTSMRTRPPSVKSFAEQEEEMLANMPKFKARPLNKRILKGPTLPPPARSIPQLPEFQEFHLKTMERALIHKHGLLSMPAINGTEIWEHTYLAGGEFDVEKMKMANNLEPDLVLPPQFKARPLDKRIFSSRGDVGIYPVPKRQATIPKEFQFATNLRAHQQISMAGDQVEQGVRTIQIPKSERIRSTNMRMCATSRSSLSEHYDENQNRHGVTNKMHEFRSQHMASEATIPLSNHRNRRPLGEIQQQSMDMHNACIQRSKIEKQDVSNTLLACHQVDEILGQAQSRKEFRQLTPGKAMERQLQRAAFPMYLMR